MWMSESPSSEHDGGEEDWIEVDCRAVDGSADRSGGGKKEVDRHGPKDCRASQRGHWERQKWWS